MAVVSTPLESALIAGYQIGVNTNGSPITRQKTFNGVKSTSSSQDIYDVVGALFGLISYPLLEVRRDNRFSLTNQ